MVCKLPASRGPGGYAELAAPAIRTNLVSPLASPAKGKALVRPRHNYLATNFQVQMATVSISVNPWSNWQATWKALRKSSGREHGPGDTNVSHVPAKASKDLPGWRLLNPPEPPTKEWVSDVNILAPSRLRSGSHRQIDLKGLVAW